MPYIYIDVKLVMAMIYDDCLKSGDGLNSSKATHFAGGLCAHTGHDRLSVFCAGALLEPQLLNEQ